MQIEREVIGKFIDASVNDHAEAERLLDAHPNLRQASWMGDEHLLNFLVIENFATGVTFCLEHGFDENQVDSEMGTTPLHYACKLNYLDIAKVLLSSGADPNSLCQIDDTPIHCAVQNGNADLVDILIQNGGNPNYTTELGETIFDNWPPWAENELGNVIRKHNVTRNSDITNG
ncbi:ankyrin repeat domain-containing protein [Mariniblastus sp.]|nr:ankyrin repeat domain-containing protein [Mariniblastus sp.]